MQTCERCHEEAPALIMSRFNTQMICLDCEGAEKKHPDYEAAAAAELAAVRAGQGARFPGIGKPPDL